MTLATPVRIDQSELPMLSVALDAPYYLIRTNCGHNASDHLHGFILANALRLQYRYLGPIIMVSTLPRTYFTAGIKDHHEYRILNGRGTGFISTADSNDPTKVEALARSIEPLSPAALIDVNTSLLNLYGYARTRIGHDLDAGMSMAERKGLLDEVRESLPPNEALAVFTEARMEALLAEPVDESAFRGTALALAEAISLLDPALGARPEQTRQPKVLVLEDQADDMARLLKGLGQAFEVLPCSSATEAVKLIDADEANTIEAIVSDWRLFVDPKAPVEARQWQELQGYEVLAHAAGIRHIALFALTSLLDHHVHAIRNVMGLDIWLQRKEHLNSEGAWASFRDVVYDACERKLDIIAGQPTGARWSIYKGMPEPAEGVKKKGGRRPADGSEPGSKQVKYPQRSFKDRYREQRNQVDWVSWEAGITKTADDLWAKHYVPLLNNRWDDLPLRSYKEWCGAEVGSVELELFDLLVYRRIYLALWCNRHAGSLPMKYYGVVSHLDQNSGEESVTQRKEHPSWDITCILSGTRPDEYQPTKTKTSEERLKDAAKAYSYSACFNHTDLAKRTGLLPEERAWLSRHGFDLPEADAEDEETGEPVTKPEPAKKPQAERTKPSKSAVSKPKKASKLDSGPSEDDIRKAEARLRRDGLL